jgi:uridine kinase
MKAPVHIAVGGGSGSGKTWLSEKLAAARRDREIVRKVFLRPSQNDGTKIESEK